MEKEFIETNPELYKNISKIWSELDIWEIESPKDIDKLVLNFKNKFNLLWINFIIPNEVEKLSLTLRKYEKGDLNSAKCYTKIEKILYRDLWIV